jgi:hypothetical protein
MIATLAVLDGCGRSVKRPTAGIVVYGEHDAVEGPRYCPSWRRPQNSRAPSPPQPVGRFGFDAAILFSDILVVERLESAARKPGKVTIGAADCDGNFADLCGDRCWRTAAVAGRARAATGLTASAGMSSSAVKRELDRDLVEALAAWLTDWAMPRRTLLIIDRVRA